MNARNGLVHIHNRLLRNLFTFVRYSSPIFFKKNVLSRSQCFSACKRIGVWCANCQLLWGASTFPSLRTPRVNSYETWVWDVVKRVLYFSMQHLLCSIIFHCKARFCLRSIGDSLHKEYLNCAILPSCLTLHSVKGGCWSHCHSWKNGGGNILNFRSCSFVLKILLKKNFSFYHGEISI